VTSDGIDREAFPRERAPLAPFRASAVLAVLTAAAIGGCRHPPTFESFGGGRTLLVRERLNTFPDWEHDDHRFHVLCADGRQLLHHVRDWRVGNAHALTMESERPRRVVLVNLARCEVQWAHEFERDVYSLLPQWNRAGSRAVFTTPDGLAVVTIDPAPTMVNVDETSAEVFFTGGPHDVLLPAWSPSGTRLLLAERTRSDPPISPNLRRLGCWSASEGLHFSALAVDAAAARRLEDVCWASTTPTDRGCAIGMPEEACPAWIAAIDARTR
jgi:hypothetical protein